jgi:recombinational DNA repair protein RecT
MSETKLEKIPLIQIINGSTPVRLAELPEVGQKFMQVYQTMHGVKDGSAFYEAEKFHFMKTIKENANLQDCTKLSLYGCFLDNAVSGLSFDSNAKHCYIVPFNSNVGTKQAPVWEKRASLMISGYGELAIRMKQGQIKYADNPVLVYEGDKFSTGTTAGQYFVEHVAVYPRTSENIIACYLRITRNDNSIDYKVFSIDEIEKLRSFSKDKNSLAWTSGLPGMIQSKTIKHAFKTYPKVRKGDFSVLASEHTEEPVEELAPIDYGIPAEESEFIKPTIQAVTTDTVTHSSTTEDDENF